MARRPHPYQHRVLHTLLYRQEPVVLQAPTGAGKTAAALWPFLHAFRQDVSLPFPAQAIYSVPMRVLANQFFAEYRQLTQGLHLREHLQVTIQTGETPLDPEFHGDLVFTTLDQTLSSLLGMPYGLSTGRANLNVGAVIGSYLVFDEFHLFPYEATRTLFHILQQLRPVMPFVLMTATFSQSMLEALGEVLNAQVEIVPPDEAHAIASRGNRPPQQRTFFTRAIPLATPDGAQAVLDTHRERTLIVLNTVDRAQRLYRFLTEAGARPVPWSTLLATEDLHQVAEARDPEAVLRPLIARALGALHDASGPWVMLLHSRFLRAHRLVKEALLRRLWGPRGLPEEQLSLLVVATQVVEVGLDISADVLHTELAPAAAVLQRAGRCARYPGEHGQVYVYPVPDDRQGNPNYAPYGQSRLERKTVEASWEAFRQRHAVVVDFPEEQAIINEAHGEQDRAVLQELQEVTGRVWDMIAGAVLEGERSSRSELIRDTLTTRTVLIYDAPTTTDIPPYGLEGFGFHIGTLHSTLHTLLSLRDALGLEWALRWLQAWEDEGEVVFQWLDVDTPEDLVGAFLLAVHPQLAAYDEEIGFRLAEVSSGAFQSPPRQRPRPEPLEYGTYRLECYHEHIAAMCLVLEQGPWKRRFAWPAARLADILGVPEEQVWQALYLTLALHDVGKLQEDWQAWAWAYQRRIGQPLPEDHCLVAHTYSDGSEEHRQAARKARPKKPNHAGEGAHASVPLIYEALEDEFLAQAVVTAIARHHSPWVEGANGYRLHPRAKEALSAALATVGLPKEWATRLHPASEAPDLATYLLDWPEPRATDELWWAWWLYFLLVRTLRVTDGLAVARDAHGGTENTEKAFRASCGSA